MVNILIVGLDIGKGSFGGITQFNKLLLKYTNNHKYQLSYFSIGKSPSWNQSKTNNSKFKFYFLHFFRFAIFVLKLLFNKFDIVVVNSNLLVKSLIRDGIFAYTAKLFGKKCIILFHGWEWSDFEKVMNSSKKKKLFFKLLNKIDTVGVSGENFRNTLESLNIKNEKTFAFSTMVESETYFITEKSYNDLPIKVLFCANPVKKEKGINEFLSAIKILNPLNENINFIVMGAGNQLNIFIDKAQEMNINQYLSFVGYVSFEEKIKIFKETLILVFPSYTEGFPNTILEAMSAGQAIITTNVGGIAEAIKHEYNGYILTTNPPEPEEIADYLKRLIKKPDIIKSMGQKNLKLASEKYDAKIIVSLIEKQFDKLINYK